MRKNLHMSEKSSNFAAQKVGLKKINQDKPLRRHTPYGLTRPAQPPY